MSLSRSGRWCAVFRYCSRLHKARFLRGQLAYRYASLIWIIQVHGSVWQNEIPWFFSVLDENSSIRIKILQCVICYQITAKLINILPPTLYIVIGVLWPYPKKTVRSFHWPSFGLSCNSLLWLSNDFIPRISIICRRFSGGSRSNRGIFM